MSGFWNPHIHYTIVGVHVELQNILRDILLLIITFISVKITKSEIRKETGGLSGEPIQQISTELIVGIALKEIFIE